MASLIKLEVVPFLVLAVGVDNLFILVHSYEVSSCFVIQQTLSDRPFSVSNGAVTGYNINCFVNDEPNTAELPGSVTSHTITGLRVFTLYTSVIIAQNVEGGGPPTSLSVLTDQDCAP